ncbi:fosmidomycin resistance protein [Natrarchaeobius halalkaliphilus]|uniref:Fosmidomycin resistance protein n=1 Tax=Natrarchaeobius halalkaliphilus TaxID=1679091 RepID=A0A3N6LWP9_9EURY|nr:VOC family protein [Natrarchaeobius halalkaliphilus]RQG93307.1 fosmidomycin resistance protein [Natrarchaeobius halalkaliphilus]
MLTGLSRLALEVKFLEPARRFYGGELGMAVRERGESELVFAAGDTDLVCRRPTGFPRGGLHTHYALSIPAEEYDEWWESLEESHDLEEMRFGEASSLYLYDPDGNCVELGQRDVPGPGIDGIFEVVLEVESVDRAESFYADLGFETIDTGTERKRVRMDGPMALELWEPQLGLADARGGVHVDLGFDAPDPTAALEAVVDRACRVESLEDGDRTRVVVRDPDGHHLVFE